MKRILPGVIFFLFIAADFPGSAAKMPGEINTGYAEFAPVISPDGQALYFTSNRPDGMGGQDLWASYFKDGVWSSPVDLPKPLNTAMNDGADDLTYDRNNIYMYLTLCNRPDGKGKCDLYLSTFLPDGSWTEPKNIGAPINTEYSEANGFFDRSQKILYFASDRPGGMGEAGKKGSATYDLWSSRQNPDGSWADPVNLGEPINTPESELKISYDAPTGWFFFSSDGHGGKGGEDLFKIKQLGPGKWGQLIPLEQINTSGNDSYFTLSAHSDYAFFNSNAGGNEDLYLVPVRDIFTDKELLARDAAYRNNCPPMVPAFGPIAKEMNAEKFCEPIPVAVATPPVERPELANRVYFQLDKSSVTDKAAKNLDPWVKLLKEDPTKKVEVAGHADSLGDPEYNMILSKRRAESVKAFLVSRGVKPEQIKTAYYGAGNPAEPNDPKSGNPKNRRVELSVRE